MHRVDTRNASGDFVSRTQNLCLPQMLHVWQKGSTFGKHDNVSNVAVLLLRGLDCN